jgi:hypothetical protein
MVHNDRMRIGRKFDGDVSISHAGHCGCPKCRAIIASGRVNSPMLVR